VNAYSDDLRDQLVAAAVREHRSRHRRRALVSAGAGVVVVAGVVALLVGVLVDPDEDAASAGQSVRATRGGDSTYVEILTPDRPDDVLTNLRAVGVEASSVDRPTGPSKVGTVVSVAIEGESTAAATPPGGLLAMYVDRAAEVVIGVGVPTPVGGLYDVATDAFAVGEPLQCRSWPGQSTADLAAVVARSEPDLDLRVIDEQTGPLEDLPIDRIVVAATAIAADRVIVMIGTGPAAGAPYDCVPATSSG
jgi:hypothetical protein